MHSQGIDSYAVTGLGSHTNQQTLFSSNNSPIGAMRQLGGALPKLPWALFVPELFTAFWLVSTLFGNQARWSRNQLGLYPTGKNLGFTSVDESEIVERGCVASPINVHRVCDAATVGTKKEQM